MKITVGKESVVCRGPAMEETHWGIYQFPLLYRLRDGRLVAQVHVNYDMATSYGLPKKYYVSEDGGRTWHDAPDSVRDLCGTRLPSGDELFLDEEKALILKAADVPREKITVDTLPKDGIEYSVDGKIPRPVGGMFDIFGQRHSLFLYDTLPAGICEKGFPVYRRKQGRGKPQRETAALDWPNFTVSGYRTLDGKSFVMTRPFCYGRIRIAPDDSVWLTHYSNYCAANPVNGAFIGHSIAIYLRSTDNAHTFQYMSHLEFVKNSDENPMAYLSGGFCEPDIAFQPDGSIITLLRTTNVCDSGPEWNPSYFARSEDGGRTWSRPVIFDSIGVLPKLVALRCGVTLAAYGRPGIYVRKSEDPAGIIWDDPIEVMPGSDRSGLANYPPARPNFHQYAGSCCNVDLIPLSDCEALLAYSDFYYPDETGFKRKTILVRHITVS